eukprot:CAMPEP_0181316948 /NCGR_PEP_ID=MMETSP1101-20121128/16166_1 /TAXON_ID=46948 /ORGANISM="Rhodomonas abbreviata, Strain Caron Lab Isolate" /LENGTH=214 /DNA_ID=CAMNT_0023424227 /DNA_START=87 /DNA_END=727 /DNA_ORIENTATION=+
MRSSASTVALAALSLLVAQAAAQDFCSGAYQPPNYWCSFPANALISPATSSLCDPINNAQGQRPSILDEWEIDFSYNVTTVEELNLGDGLQNYTFVNLVVNVTSAEVACPPLTTTCRDALQALKCARSCWRCPAATSGSTPGPPCPSMCTDTIAACSEMLDSGCDPSRTRSEIEAEINAQCQAGASCTAGISAGNGPPPPTPAPEGTDDDEDSG